MTIVEELAALAAEWRQAAEELRTHASATPDGATWQVARDAGIAQGYDQAASTIELMVERWRRADQEVQS